LLPPLSPSPDPGKNVIPPLPILPGRVISLLPFAIFYTPLSRWTEVVRPHNPHYPHSLETVLLVFPSFPPNVGSSVVPPCSLGVLLPARPFLVVNNHFSGTEDPSPLFLILSNNLRPTSLAKIHPDYTWATYPFETGSCFSPVALVTPCFLSFHMQAGSFLFSP